MGNTYNPEEIQIAKRLKAVLESNYLLEEFGERFSDELMTDEESPASIFKRIFEQYIRGSHEVRYIINDMFISLCGWGINTLLDKIGAEEEEEANDEEEEDEIISVPASAEVKDVIYALCEEYEDRDAIRQFTILKISRDENKLKALMQKEIEEDKYGYIKDKGVDDHTDTHFSSNFNDGFVEYYILEEKID